MGRDWYFTWGSKSSSKKAGTTATKGGGGSRVSGSKKPSVAPVAAAVAASGGCMNAVLHMFDFNHFHLCLHPTNTSYLPDEPVSVKGVEAPRNSLESITEDDDKRDSLNIPMVKTKRRDIGLKLVQAPRAKVEDTLSQSSCSPTSARTPTLVARLMGLDILPESNNTTPRSSSCYSPHITSSTPPPPSRGARIRTKTSYKNEVQGQRSMPETPNSMSSTQRRRSTDVVDPHRLSLQMNNVKSIVKEMESSRPSCSAINTKRREGRKYDDENKSPGYYAKQIMKQVRETVSRRVGADITNTVHNTQREIRRDEHLLNSIQQPTKSKKKKESSLSTSPKLIKSSEISSKISEDMPNVQQMVDKLQMKQLRSENEKQVKNGHDCSKKKDIDLKKVGGIKLRPYDSIKNKKDEQFVRNSTRANNSSTDKKCKKTPLSSDLVHASVPSIIPLKKDSSSTSPKLLEKQEGSSKAQVSNHDNNTSTAANTTTRLCRSPCQRTYDKLEEEATHRPIDPTKKDTTNTSTSTSTSTSIAQFQYISRILKCTGIDRDTPISFTRWYSPSHPLDPSIFDALEDSHYHTTTTAKPVIHSSSDINRKLIFHLVDEILADILQPYIKLRPYYHYHKHHHQRHQQINGFQLVKTLCTKLRSFPSKNCQTLQDIDALVEEDMPRFGVATNPVAFEEEGEAIVAKIEGDIVDSLIQEMAMILLRK